MGSKRRLAAPILARFPKHRCYVEAFAGSAALLFARSEPAQLEVLNDVDGDLVNFFRVVKHHLVEFCHQFRFLVVSRKQFDWANATPPVVLTDIQRAARFLYLQKLCFGGKPTGRTFGVVTSGPPRFNLSRVEEDVSEIHARLERVVIESLDWRACLARYDRAETLFFLDPPYYQTAGYDGPAWTLANFVDLAGTLRKLRGKALLTVNDHPELRRVFDGFAHELLEVRYTVGLADKRARPKSRELLFRTWGGR
jgi:DNA adenine methylase